MDDDLQLLEMTERLRVSLDDRHEVALAEVAHRSYLGGHRLQFGQLGEAEAQRDGLHVALEGQVEDAKFGLDQAPHATAEGEEDV